MSMMEDLFFKQGQRAPPSSMQKVVNISGEQEEGKSFLKFF